MARDFDPKKILRRSEELVQEAKGLLNTAARLRRETAKAAAKRLRARRKPKPR